MSMFNVDNTIMWKYKDSIFKCYAEKFGVLGFLQSQFIQLFKGFNYFVSQFKRLLKCLVFAFEFGQSVE